MKAKIPSIQPVMNHEHWNRVCVVLLLTDPKYQNIITNVEATELGFLLEAFNLPSSLPFPSHKRREPRYLMSVPQKTDFQLLGMTPSIPTCLFWIPTGHSQQHKQRAPPASNGALSFFPFHSFNLDVSRERLGPPLFPFLEGTVQEQMWGWGRGAFSPPGSRCL